MSSGEPKSQVPNSKPNAHRQAVLFPNYVIGGAFGGAFAGAMAGTIDYAVYEEWIPVLVDDVPWQLRELLRPDIPDYSAKGFFIGACCGALFWFVTLFWPAIRNPWRATSFCASLAGTLFLIAATLSVYFRGLRYPREFERLVFYLPCTLAFGALFGLITSMFVPVMRYVFTIFRGPDRNGISS
jgi:hypothetical protein